MITWLYLNTDKLLHFISGIAIFMVAFYFTKNNYYSFYIVSLIGLIKECYDSLIKKTYFSIKDFFSTVLGAILVFTYNFLVV